jgi:hypothetical protein
MHETMNSELVRQRHEELLRETEMNRQARALRATRRRNTGRNSTLAWEIKRLVGSLLKLLRRTLRNAD